MTSILRQKDATNLEKVEYLIAESTGDFIVAVDNNSLPITKLDMSMTPSQDILSQILIYKGKVDGKVLKKNRLNYEWVQEELKSSNIDNINDIYLGILTSDKKLYISGDGKYVLVSNNEDNNVSIIDAKTYKLINNVAVGKGPHGFRISSDSKYAYVVNMSEDTVSVVDIKNSKELKKIKVGNTPVTTGITKDGKTLVATVNGENAMAIVDLTTDKVEKVAVGVGPAQLYLDPDDKYVFVANQGTEENPSNTVSKIDLSTKKVVATIETGKGSHGVVVSPDNKYTYVTNMYEATVSVIDNATNKVIATIPVDGEPNGISFKK